MATPESSERLLGGTEVELATIGCDELAAAPATCGTASVPVDWTKPNDSTIDVSYVLLPAASVAASIRTVATSPALVEPLPVGPTTYSPALFNAIACNDYVVQFDVDVDISVRRWDFEHRLDELSDAEFDMFSKQGWIGSGSDEGDMCLAWPAPDIAPELRIPFPDSVLLVVPNAGACLDQPVSE